MQEGPASAAEVEELRRQIAVYRELIDAVNCIVLRWDPQGRVTYLNRYGLDFFGYRLDEVVGRSVIGLIVPETESSGRDLVRMIHDILVHPERYRHNENENIRRNGERVWITWRNHPVVDADGRLVELVSIGIDTTERKRAEEALRASEERFRRLAQLDSLSGLYNTRYLYDDLGARIAAGERFALVFMDLDDFKQVVDTYGHLNGSRVIQEVAATLRAHVPGPGYAVAYAGDEFVIVLPGADRSEALATAERLRHAVADTTYLRQQGHAVRLTASFGVATCPDDAADLEALMALADEAVFGVKARGKNAVGTSRRPRRRRRA